MAPARTSTRRTQHDQTNSSRPAGLDENNGPSIEQLFLEPMMGTPLTIYVEKDVKNRDTIVNLITVSRTHNPFSETVDVSSKFRVKNIFWLDRNVLMTRPQTKFDCVLISFIRIMAVPYRQVTVVSLTYSVSNSSTEMPKT